MAKVEDIVEFDFMNDDLVENFSIKMNDGVVMVVQRLKSSVFGVRWKSVGSTGGFIPDEDLMKLEKNYTKWIRSKKLDRINQ